MSSGVGVVLAEERREEDGEGSDRMWNPGGGEGERVRTDSSDSQSDKSVSGELGPPPLNINGAIVKGMALCLRQAWSVKVVDAFGSDGRGVVQREPRRTTCAEAQLRDTAANAADLDDAHNDISGRVAHVTIAALRLAGASRESWCCGRVRVEALKAWWIAAVTAGRGGGADRAGLQGRGTTLNHSDCYG